MNTYRLKVKGDKNKNIAASDLSCKGPIQHLDEIEDDLITLHEI